MADNDGFDLSDREEEEEEFFDSFSTLFYKRPRHDLWVFWGPDDHEIQPRQQQISRDMVGEIIQPQLQRQQGFGSNYINNVSLSADVDTQRMMIPYKIKNALCEADFSAVHNIAHFIIQFWAPVTTSSGGRLLSTSGQPFAVNFLGGDLSVYRQHCLKYQYSIKEDNMFISDSPTTTKEDNMIISDSPTATAFLNCFPELVLLKNLKCAGERAGPLVYYALECGFEYSYMLPVYFSSTNSCIGVLEFSTLLTCSCETIIATIRKALKEVDLHVFQIQDRIPYQKIDGLKTARDEIQEALKTVCESIDASLAQVWIAFKDMNHVPFPSSSEGIRMKQMLSLKLTGCLYDRGPEESSWPTRDYYQLCDTFPLETGDDFVGKTLEDRKSRICYDISKLSGDTLVKDIFHYDDDDRYRRLAICLNSIHTKDFCYVFEFFWWKNLYTDVDFVTELLVKLKVFLPSFTHVSGAKLGDELDFINVGDSTATDTKFLKISQGNRSSMATNNRISLSREAIEAQHRNTLITAAGNLNDTLKRKCREHGITNWEGPKRSRADDEEVTRTTLEAISVNRNENTLTIKAELAGDVTKISCPFFEATFETVKKEIEHDFQLTPGTYKVKYLDDDREWILLNSEKHMSDCIKSLRGSNVRLRVEPFTQPISRAATEPSSSSTGLELGSKKNEEARARLDSSTSF